MKQWLRVFGLASLVALAVSCGGGDEHADHDHGQDAADHGHHHEPPHGGTAVTFGDEDFHVEFVPDVSRGVIEAFFFSPHMEEFLRVPLESFTVTFGARETVFAAHASKATGETAGDTSMFVAKTPWLPGSETVEASIDGMELFGRRYERIEFELTLP